MEPVSTAIIVRRFREAGGSANLRAPSRKPAISFRLIVGAITANHPCNFP